MTRFLIILLLVFAAGNALAFQNEPELANNKQELRAENLFKQIRCLVCKGESLAESDAELASDMRALIRDKVKHGETDKQIKQYLTERYGEGILQKPHFIPATYFLWLTPVILLIIGSALILRTVRIKKYFKRNGRN